MKRFYQIIILINLFSCSNENTESDSPPQRGEAENGVSSKEKSSNALTNEVNKKDELAAEEEKLVDVKGIEASTENDGFEDHIEAKPKIEPEESSSEEPGLEEPIDISSSAMLESNINVRISNNKIDVDWAPYAGAKSYFYLISGGGDHFKGILTGVGDKYTFSLDSTSGVEYYISIFVCAGENATECSSNRTVLGPYLAK